MADGERAERKSVRRASAGGGLQVLCAGGSQAPSVETYGLWGRAFRPFFLGLACYGALAIPWWTLVWLGLLPAPSWLIPTAWHGHEMVFGFAAAAVAGFVLTASPVWTGGPALSGRPLAALFALWVLGRVALAVGDAVPAWLVAAVDGAFLPAVALALVWTLWGAAQSRNYGIVAIVIALAVGNGFVHAEALGLASGVAVPGLRLGVDLIIVLLVLIGGRITPAFTENALRRAGHSRSVRSWPWLNAVAIGAAGLLALVTLVAGRTLWSGLLAALAGLAVALRLAGWQTWAIRSDPLLWSLHCAAAWVTVGLLFVAASDLGAAIPTSAGLHALTAGAIGTGILAVITRVSLGHTGRPLRLPPSVVWSYALVQGAAIARVAMPFCPAHAQSALLMGSGLAWAAAFGLFALRYGSILTAPRLDGKPG